jgi:hypothetical protein
MAPRQPCKNLTSRVTDHWREMDIANVPIHSIDKGISLTFSTAYSQHIVLAIEAESIMH